MHVMIVIHERAIKREYKPKYDGAGESSFTGRRRRTLDYVTMLEQHQSHQPAVIGPACCVWSGSHG